MEKATFQSLLIGFIIGVVWGYFADLRYGDVNGFIERIIFILIFVFLVRFLMDAVQSYGRNKER